MAWFINKFEELDLENNETAQKLLHRYIHVENPELENILEEKLYTLIQERQVYPFNETTPNHGYVDDIVVLGETLKNRETLSVQEKHFTQHCLVTGATGEGKTTMFRNVMSQLTAPFWAFDRKQDYRHMITELDQLLVLPWNQLKFNPLKPPENVDPNKWAQIFTEIFGHSTALLSGSKNYILTTVFDLYTDYELFYECSPPYPSLFELFVKMDEDKINFTRKTSNYRDTGLNRLKPFKMAAGKVFDCSQGYKIRDLMQRCVVFELEGLNRDLQRFLQEILFAYVYEYQLANTERGNGLELVIFVDEAKQLFSVYLEKQDASGIPEIDDLTARAREMGLGLIVADQEASKLTESIKANTGIKVLLRVGDSTQLDIISDSINLNELQRDFAYTLGTGQALVKYQGRPVTPVDLYNYEVGQVTESALKQALQSEWSNLEYSDRSNSNTYSGRSEPDKAGSDTGNKSSSEPETVDTVEIQLDSESGELFKHIAQRPFDFVTERYNELELSYYKGNKAKKDLLKKGLVEEKKVKKGKTRGTLFEVTDRGEEYLDDNDVELHRKGRGGIRHRYWQHKLKEKFEEQGWETQIEWNGADLYCAIPDTDLVVEVAMGKYKREISHVEKHLDNVDKVVVACRNKSVQEWVKGKLENRDGYSNVEIRQVSDLV